MELGELTVSKINIHREFRSDSVKLSIILNKNPLKMSLRSGLECKFSKTDFQIKEKEIPVFFEPLNSGGGGKNPFFYVDFDFPRIVYFKRLYYDPKKDHHVYINTHHYPFIVIVYDGDIETPLYKIKNSKELIIAEGFSDIVLGLSGTSKNKEEFLIGSVKYCIEVKLTCQGWQI